MSGSVVHFEIGAQNIAEVRRFYAELFGWRFDSTDPGYAVMDGTDGGIGGGIMQIREDMPPYITVYVAVDDIPATLARAKELGGSPVLGPQPVPTIGEFALFHDPEGHLVGLLHLQEAR